MAENFVNIIRDIRGSTNDPATDTSCIYGDMKSMHEEYKGFKQITDEERLKLENIEEEATKNSTDGFLLSRENHTGNMSIANVQDTPSRMAMTIHEKNKLEAINVDATKNDTDANLRNRATHTGTQSIDTITDTSTHVKMSVTERSKLSEIATGATKNATDAELRSRSTHTGTQSADSIVDGLVNAAYTLQEKNKLSVLNTTVPPAHTHDNTSIMSLSYSKLTGVPETFYPSEHLHSMNEITTGNLDASRINQTNSMQFVNSIEKEKITNAESMNNKGTPFGYAPLDGNGKINPSYLDALNVIDVFTPVNQEAMLLLTSAKPGDIAYVQDSQNTYMLVALPVHLQYNWKQMNSGSGVITFNGLNGVVSVGTDEIPEGSANVYFTNERVDDRVANLLAPGANVSMVYNDDTTQIIISANETSIEWSEIQNKPNTKIDVNLSGDISGSGSVTLSQLGNGTLNIANMTLESAGTAGTYTKVTTNTKGQVVAGTALSAGDIPSLDASKITSGIIDIDRLPASAGSIPEYATLSEFPLVGDSGKVYIALDTNKMYRWSGSTYVSIAGGVDSVAGKTGVVSLAKGDVGLANVDNTSDIDKPISTDTQTALNTKVDITGDQTIAGVKTFSSTVVGNITGNSGTATKLQTARTINGVAFDGTANIVVSDTTAVNLTGNQTIAGVKTFSSNIVGNITGNAATATKLATARTINGVAFDGTSNITVSDSTKLTKANPLIMGSITEQVYDLTGTAINPANGTIQYKTVSSNTTFTETLITGQSVILRLVNANSYTITFPTITWVGAVAPTLTANCAIVVWKEQSTLYGAFVGSFV